MLCSRTLSTVLSYMYIRTATLLIKTLTLATLRNQQTINLHTYRIVSTAGNAFIIIKFYTLLLQGKLTRKPSGRGMFHDAVYQTRRVTKRRAPGRSATPYTVSILAYITKHDTRTHTHTHTN